MDMVTHCIGRGWLYTVTVGGIIAACSASPDRTFTGPVDGGTASDGAYPIGTSSCPGGIGSRVTGRTYAPNGIDPIPGVLVYLTNDSATFPAASTAVACQQCVMPAGTITSTHAGPDGSFTLSGSALDHGGTFTLVVESGGFRHVQRQVVVPACGEVSLTAAQTRMPGVSSGDDTIPHIAVAGYRSTSSSTSRIDVNDKFTHVLDAIGITGYDTVDPDKTGTSGGRQSVDLIGLLSDMSQLSQYQIVIAPCGSLGNFAVAQHITPAMVTNLHAWLGMGGRLYASDLAYSVIDQGYAGAITFAPGPSSHTGADPADVGVGLATSASLQATVDDLGLRTWLQNVGVLASGATTIPVMDLKDPWGAMDSVPDAELSGGTGPSGVVLVSGDVMWHTGTGGHHPLTAMVDYAGSSGASCGRVVFTSYHVQSNTSGTALSPQERVLEYLFFQLSSCIQVPG